MCHQAVKPVAAYPGQSLGYRQNMFISCPAGLRICSPLRACIYFGISLSRHQRIRSLRILYRLPTIRPRKPWLALKIDTALIHSATLLPYENYRSLAFLCSIYVRFHFIICLREKNISLSLTDYPSASLSLIKTSSVSLTLRLRLIRRLFSFQVLT